MQIPNGLFLDKFGTRILPFFTIAALCGATIFWLHESDAAFIISRVLIGLGCSIAFAGGIYIATQLFAANVRAVAIALVSVSASSGAILGTSFCQLLLNHFGWEGTHLLICLFILIVAVLVIITVKKLHRHMGSKTAKANISLQSIKVLLVKRKAVAIYIYSFFTWFIMMAFAGYWAKSYFENMHHYTKLTSLELMQFCWIMYLITTLSISFFIHGLRDCIRALKALSLLNMLAFAIMALPVLYEFQWLVILLMLTGMGTAGLPLSFSILSYIVPSENIGLAVAINNTCMVIGGLCGQLVFGSMVNEFGSVFFFHDILMNHYLALLSLTFSATLAFLAVFLGLKHEPAPTES